MRRFKRIAALMLVVVLISSLCTFQFVATVAAEETISTIEVSDDDLLLIEKLEAFGAISNEYDPSGYATRREMAEIITRYIKLPVDNESTASPFGDVALDDGSIGAISGLYNMGIITGDENRNFYPDKNVTYDEAIVFIVNAVGYKMFAQRSGGYPTGYYRIAIQHGMLNNLKMSSGKADIPIIDIYKMLNAALSAAKIETVYYGSGDDRYSLSTTDTFMSETYGIRKYRGKVTGNEWTHLSSPSSGLTDEQIEIDNEIYDTPGYVYGYFLGYMVDYYLAKTHNGEMELMYIEETPKANKVIKIDSDDILDKTTSNRIYYKENNEEEHIDFVSYLDVIYNSQSHIGYGLLENILPSSGYIEALDNNNDGKYDVLFVYDYQNVIVKSVDTYNQTITDVNGVKYDLDDEKNARILSSENGSSLPFGVISKGKALSIAKGKSSKSVITVYVLKETVSGKITEYSSEEGYLINGEYYKVASDYYGNTLKLGLSGKFQLDLGGKIVTYEYDDSNENINIAVTADIGYELNRRNNTVTLRIFTSQGKMEDHNLKLKVKINEKSYDLSKVEEREAAVKKLCNNEDSSDPYIYDSYVIKYTLDEENNIDYIDMGVSGTLSNVTEGALNILADHYTAVRVCGGSILAMYDDQEAVKANDPAKAEPNGSHITTRMSANKVIFVTPEAGKLDDTDAFSTLKSMSLNHFYANPGYFVYAGDQVGITDFSAYTLGKTEYPMIDAILLRGTGAVAEIGNNNVKVNVISRITNAVKDDYVVPKLYQGDTVIGILGDSVSYTRSGSTVQYGVGGEPGNTVENLINNGLIGPGSVVQTSLDNEGYIRAIKIISEYDYTNKKIVPLFREDGGYVGTPSMYNQPYNNFSVGTVTGIDEESGILSFKAGDYDLVVDITTAPAVYVFDVDEQDVRVGSLDDIQVERVFTMRSWSSYTAKEVIVFQ